MIRKVFLVALFFNCLGLWAQQAISGYVNRADASSWETTIHLSKISLNTLPNYEQSTLIASSKIAADGFFSFDKEVLSNTNQIYLLHVNRIQRLQKERAQHKQLFILSAKDTIHFKKGNSFFAKYETTNIADAEWQQLRNFESKFYTQLQDNKVTRGTLNPMRSYTKDSLQILLVKLLGIKQLENKALLDTDIDANPFYYMALLRELKASDLPASEYQFLERRLAFLTQDVVEEKYALSRWINLVLGILLVGLLFVFMIPKRRKRLINNPDLSKQERAIQELILSGKTNKEIAAALFISVSTVKTHITHIYTKLNVGNRQELLRRFQN